MNGQNPAKNPSKWGKSAENGLKNGQKWGIFSRFPCFVEI